MPKIVFELVGDEVKLFITGYTAPAMNVSYNLRRTALPDLLSEQL